jgi:hypothetical protein
MIASRYSVRQSSSLAGTTRGIDRARGRVAAHLATGVEQHRPPAARDGSGGRRVDQQRLGRAADAGAPHLGVQHDLPRHFEVRRLVDIDVADAFEVGENRHARLLLHARDQALAAARHDHVDAPLEPRQHHRRRRRGPSSARAGSHASGSPPRPQARYQAGVDGRLE